MFLDSGILLYQQYCHYRLLDPLLTRQCDEYRRVYADILYAWNLLDKRSEVLKYQVGRLAQLNGQVKLRSICHQCGQLVKGPSCKESHCFAFTCSICNLSVRGECWQNCCSAMDILAVECMLPDILYSRSMRVYEPSADALQASNTFLVYIIITKYGIMFK